MQNFKTPGVFVEEVSTLPASVAPVATAIPAFVGYTEKHTNTGANDDSLLNVPTRISSMNEYIEMFGGAFKEKNLVLTFDDVYDSADNLINRTVEASFSRSTIDIDGNPGVDANQYDLRSPLVMYYALQMYFANGGGPCWIVSINKYSTLALNGGVPTMVVADFNGPGNGINTLEKVDEPTLIVCPDAVNFVRPDTTPVPDPDPDPAQTAAARPYTGYADYDSVIDTAVDQCNKLQDRFTIVDVFDASSINYKNSIESDSSRFRNAVAPNAPRYAASYYPSINTTLSYAYDEAEVTVVHNITGGTPPPVFYPDPANPGDPENDNLGAVTDLAAKNQGILALRNLRVNLPASGAIAGIYARVDRNRGVWQAPANVGIGNVVGPARTISAAAQGNLNVDVTAGKSINAIREFTGKGTLVWGARTLAGNDNEWRYVSVRRLFIFLEESIKKATEFVVFEPNDANTWLRVKTMIESFLNIQFSAGALAGSTPEQAYFVNVGLGQTMTPQDILEGRMIIEIGLAAVRPAEFIILRFSHKLQEA